MGKEKQKKSERKKGIYLYWATIAMSLTRVCSTFSNRSIPCPKVHASKHDEVP